MRLEQSSLAKEGLVTPVTPKRKEEMTKKTPSFGDPTDDCLKDTGARISEDHGKTPKELWAVMWHAPDHVRHQLFFS